MEFKIHILIYGEIKNRHTGIILIIILFVENFKHGDGPKFWYYVMTNAETLCVQRIL